jgi:hypothetical protein
VAFASCSPGTSSTSSAMISSSSMVNRSTVEARYQATMKFRYLIQSTYW